MHRSSHPRRRGRVRSTVLVGLVATALAASLLPVVEAPSASAVGAAGLVARPSEGAQDTPLREEVPAARSGFSTFGQWWTNSDGSRTERLFAEPAFRREGGKWTRVDPSVRPAAGEAAFAAEAVLPTTFFGDENRVVELTTERGPLRLAARDLSIGEPKLVDGVVEYSNVAKDTDLRYRVTADAVKEDIVLGSAASPRSFEFHLADPAGVLGEVTQQPNGSWRFNGEVAPDLALVLPPAIAYEEPRPGEPVPADPSSASLQVRPSPGGFDLTISVDDEWLVGKSFPIILDPTLTLTGASGTAIDGYTYSGSTGNYLIDTTGSKLYAGSNASHAYRSFVRFNISQVPFHSAVSSAELGMYVDSCSYSCTGTPYSLGVRRMTGAWGASSTSVQLAGLIGSTDLASVAGATTFAGTYLWQQFDLTSQVQRWVNGEDPNYGLGLRVADETLGRAGPAWPSSEGADPATRPYLQVTYTANASNGYPPANPGSTSGFVWGAGGLGAGVGEAVPPAPRRAVFEASDHSMFTWWRPVGSSSLAASKKARWSLNGSASGSSFGYGELSRSDATGAGDAVWAIGKPLASDNAVEVRWRYVDGNWTTDDNTAVGVPVGSPVGTGALTIWRDSRNGRIWSAYLAPAVVGTATETHLFSAQSTDSGATFGSETDLGAPLGTSRSAQFVPLASGGVGLLHHGDGIRWYPSAVGASSTVVFTPAAPQSEFTMSWQAAATDDGLVHLIVSAPGGGLKHYRLVSGAWSLYTTIESQYRDLSVSSFGEGLWLATNEGSQIRLRRFETESGTWDAGQAVASGTAGRPALPERSNRYQLPVMRHNAAAQLVSVSRYDDLGPIIEMLAPGDGSLLTGSVTVRALPDDPGLGTAGVQRMDFYVDRGNGAIGYLGSDSTADAAGEFSYTWNTDVSDGGSGKLWPSGAYRIYTVGWDLAGNRSESGRLTGYIDRKDLGVHAARPSHSAAVGDVKATVNLVNGNLVVAQSDPSHSTVIGPLSLTRTFNSQDLTDRKVGPGWALSADMDAGLMFRELVDYSAVQGVPTGTVSLVEPDGTEHFYFTDGKGGYVSFIEDSSVLKRNGDSTWTLVLLDGTRYEFGTDRKLMKIVAAGGSSSTFTYTYNGSGELTSIAEPGGRSMTLTYVSGKVSTIAEFDATKTWTYTYTSNRLTRVTDPAGTYTQYGYDTTGRINQITDRGGSILYVDYDPSGRVSAFRQRHLVSGSPVDYTTSFEYTNATTSKVTAFRGNLTGCDATCKTYYTTTHTFDAQRRQTGISRTLPNGSTVTSSNGWDEPGNLTGARRPRNHPTSTTDFLGRRTGNFYDEIGNLTKTTDPASSITTRRYDEGYGGLAAEYFPNTSLTPSTGFPIRRLDPTVNFDWGSCATAGTCSPHASIPADNFSARWTGWVDVPTDGSWIFSTEVDDGVRLYIDGNLLLDYWVPSSTIRTAAPIVLKAGLHEISLQHYEGAVGAKMKLRWKGPGVSTQVIPASNLKPGLGLETSMTGPDGHVSANVYDDPFTKRVIEESENNTDLDGTVTTLRTRYDYTDPATGQPDVFGRLRRKTLPNGNTGATADPAYSTVYAYYGTNETATDACTGASANQAGQLKSETSGTSGAVTPITHVYDIRGNEVRTVDGNGAACMAYNARSQQASLKAADRATATTFTYTPDGMLDTVADPVAGGTTNYDYDDLDRLTLAADGFGGTTTYAYDTFTPATQVTTLTDPSGVRASTTDQAGRNTQVTYTPTGGTAQIYAFSYDATDALDIATYPNGATADRDYDAAGRLSALRNHASGGTAIADYAMAYDSESHRTIEDGPAGRWKYGYDSVGRLERVHDPIGYTRRYRFDRNTNRTGLDTAAGLHWQRGVGPDTDAITPMPITDPNEGSSAFTVPFAFPFYGQSYTQLYVSPNGYITTSPNTSPKPDLDTTRGIFPLAKDQKLGTGIIATNQDDLLNPTWFEVRWRVQPQPADLTDTENYNDFSVILHKDGRITISYRTIADGTSARVGYSAGDTWNFANIGGLDNANVPTAAPSVDISPHAATSTTATYDAIDRWTAAGVTYDTAGNTKTIGSATYTYDARNLLTATGTPTQSSAFVFDGEGRQIKSTTAGVERRIRYGAPGDSGASYETNAANAVTASTLSGPSGLLATYTGTTPLYYFTSPRGDVAATVNTAGATTTSPLYDEYGNPTGSQPTYGFLATHRKQRDPATGVTVMGARAYNPATGRFLQTDPIEGGLDTNDYSYVRDPINQYDLNGEGFCALGHNPKKKGQKHGGCRGGGAAKAAGGALKKATGIACRAAGVVSIGNPKSLAVFGGTQAASGFMMKAWGQGAAQASARTLARGSLYLTAGATILDIGCRVTGTHRW